MSEAAIREIELAEGGLLVRIAPVGILTVNRPERLNALDRRLLGAIAEAVAMLEDESTVRALVLTGSGSRAFVAGADLREIAELGDAGAAESFSRQGQAALARIATSPLPTIAAVNGLALGGGCELAISCDLRVAARGAAFAMPEVGLGLIPGFGGTQRLPRLIGQGAAMRMILSGEMIDAETALGYGLVESVVDDGQVLESACALAARIAKHPAAAVAAAKAAIHKGATLPLAQGLIAEAQRFGERVSSQESREAIAAFFESRRSSR